MGAALLAHPWACPVRFVAHEEWEWVSRLSAARLPGSARQNSTDDLLAEELKAMMEELELKAMMQELEAREVMEPEEETPEEAPASRHSRRLLSSPVRLRHVRPTGGPPSRRLLQTLDNTVQSPHRRR